MDYEVAPNDWDNYNWELVEEIRAKNRMKKILKFIPKEGFHLDIGTGRGEGTQEVNNIKPTIGIDYGNRSLNIAKTYDLNLFQADGRHLPFKDRLFNSITALDVLEHVPEPNIFLDEVFRTLSDDGIFIFQTPVAETEKIKDWAKEIYNKHKIIQKLDKIFFVFRSSKKINSVATNRLITSQPYDTAIKNRDLLSLISSSNFEITKRKKISYFASSYFLQLFCYSDLFLCKKMDKR
jgi:ubiquinone/menaquinone biosynthesis C-methylase UbiE